MTAPPKLTGGHGRRVVVIGGGVVGVACAHYLTDAGFRVTVVDRGAVGGACSLGNCGFVCPSHVLPLAEPGAIGATLRTAWRRDSPLKINPGLDPRRWLWLLRFAARCNAADMRAGGRAIQPLLRSSMGLYRGLVARGLDCSWEERGLLFAYRSKAAFESYGPTDELLRAEFGEPAERLDGEAVREREPALVEGLAGGWFFEEDAHLRPDRLMTAWAASLRDRGAELVEHAEATAVRAQDGRITSVEAGGRIVPCDHVVAACGAWSPLLQKLLGVHVPVVPGKGYSVRVRPDGPSLRTPVILPETRVALTPDGEDLRLGSMMEIGGHDSSMRARRLALLRKGAQPYLKATLPEEHRDPWHGWRPMTSDSVPIIGPAGPHANLTLATGHNMLGLSMAPATGRLVAELLTGAEPHVDAAPYRLGRGSSAAAA